jgi:hypothetical protein
MCLFDANIYDHIEKDWKMPIENPDENLPLDSGGTMGEGDGFSSRYLSVRRE